MGGYEGKRNRVVVRVALSKIDHRIEPPQAPSLRSLAEVEPLAQSATEWPPEGTLRSGWFNKGASPLECADEHIGILDREVTHLVPLHKAWRLQRQITSACYATRDDEGVIFAGNNRFTNVDPKVNETHRAVILELVQKLASAATAQ